MVTLAGVWGLVPFDMRSGAGTTTACLLFPPMISFDLPFGQSVLGAHSALHHAYNPRPNAESGPRSSVCAAAGIVHALECGPYYRIQGARTPSAYCKLLDLRRRASDYTRSVGPRRIPVPYSAAWSATSLMRRGLAQRLDAGCHWHSDTLVLQYCIPHKSSPCPSNFPVR
ncbi:hypothetical protein BJV78DRAFT_1192191 [Lactifluus subvellereus]|nr:hypothetical protein BJV78DRAFT_1192191 [Lactifluus subvellereus]